MTRNVTSFCEPPSRRCRANYDTFAKGPVRVMVRAVEDRCLYEVDVFGESTFSFYGNVSGS
jgi:hypothetical protein